MDCQSSNQWPIWILNNVNNYANRNQPDELKILSPSKLQANAPESFPLNQFKPKLSQREERPEYEPTRRDVAERRVINDGGLSKSIQSIQALQVFSLLINYIICNHNWFDRKLNLIKKQLH